MDSKQQSSTLPVLIDYIRFLAIISNNSLNFDDIDQQVEIFTQKFCPSQLGLKGYQVQKQIELYITHMSQILEQTAQSKRQSDIKILINFLIFAFILQQKSAFSTNTQLRIFLYKMRAKYEVPKDDDFKDSKLHPHFVSIFKDYLTQFLMLN